jgi:Zn-dependent alcohol dehydrogenase
MYIISLHLQGRLLLEELVTKTITLSESSEGYQAMKDEPVARVVITSFD